MEDNVQKVNKSVDIIYHEDPDKEFGKINLNKLSRDLKSTLDYNTHEFNKFYEDVLKEKSTKINNALRQFTSNFKPNMKSKKKAEEMVNKYHEYIIY